MGIIMKVTQPQCALSFKIFRFYVQLASLRYFACPLFLFNVKHSFFYQQVRPKTPRTSIERNVCADEVRTRKEA